MSMLMVGAFEACQPDGTHPHELRLFVADQSPRPFVELDIRGEADFKAVYMRPGDARTLAELLTRAAQESEKRS